MKIQNKKMNGILGRLGSLVGIDGLNPHADLVD